MREGRGETPGLSFCPKAPTVIWLSCDQRKLDSRHQRAYIRTVHNRGVPEMESRMSEDDARYFHRRAGEERQRAADAADPCAKQVHQRIASEYERIASADNPIELRVVSK
jgi:hypothetical protein